jgi:T5SS/PEP-CTERM-associated repeat protein
MIESAIFQMATWRGPIRSPQAVAKPARWQDWRARLLGTSAIAGIIAALSASPVRADNDWTGASSTDWFTAGNWSNGVPATSDLVEIDNASVPNPAVIGSPGATALQLDLGKLSSGSLSILSGGTLSTALASIGVFGTGSVLVSGAGSAWNFGNLLAVGPANTGTLGVLNGGAVSGSDLTVSNGRSSSVQVARLRPQTK